MATCSFLDERLSCSSFPRTSNIPPSTVLIKLKINVSYSITNNAFRMCILSFMLVWRGHPHLTDVICTVSVSFYVALASSRVVSLSYRTQHAKGLQKNVFFGTFLVMHIYERRRRKFMVCFKDQLWILRTVQRWYFDDSVTEKRDDEFQNSLAFFRI